MSTIFNKIYSLQKFGTENLYTMEVFLYQGEGSVCDLLSKSDWDTSWKCFMYDNSELSC